VKAGAHAACRVTLISRVGRSVPESIEPATDHHKEAL
jgi:hypothetical protein